MSYTATSLHIADCMIQWLSLRRCVTGCGSKAGMTTARTCVHHRAVMLRGAEVDEDGDVVLLEPWFAEDEHRAPVFKHRDDAQQWGKGGRALGGWVQRQRVARRTVLNRARLRRPVPASASHSGSYQ